MKKKDQTDKFSYHDPDQIKETKSEERRTPAGVPVEYENAVRK